MRCSTSISSLRAMLSPRFNQLRGLRGFCEGFGQTLAAIFLFSIRYLPTPCEGCEGFCRVYVRKSPERSAP